MPGDTTPFPPGPYTEEQLKMLERGWYGRPTMQTVVGEVRRLMAENTELKRKLEVGHG